MSMTYVVEDHGVILYAGQDFVKAASEIRRSQIIEVWENDSWIGNINHRGWLYKTLQHPDIAAHPADDEGK